MHIRVNWLVGLKIERYFLFLAFICKDSPHEQNEAVWRYAVVQLQPLLGAGDGSEHRETIDTRFNVRRSTVLLRQHGRDTRDLILVSEGSLVSVIMV